MELREKVKQFKPKRQIRKKLIRIFLNSHNIVIFLVCLWNFTSYPVSDSDAIHFAQYFKSYDLVFLQ